jgi:hypothetical protein
MSLHRTEEITNILGKKWEPTKGGESEYWTNYIMWKSIDAYINKKHTYLQVVKYIMRFTILTAGLRHKFWGRKMAR